MGILLRNKKILFCLFLGISLILFSILGEIARGALWCTYYWCTCIRFSVNTIGTQNITIHQGNSVNLILEINSTPDSCDTTCTITRPDGSKVINNVTYGSDGIHSYTETPSGLGDHIYTVNCNGCGGSVSDSVKVTVTNNPPNAPQLQAPLNNTWINYNPTFQAVASDPDGDQVKVCFDLDSNGSCDHWAGLGPSGSIFSWLTTIGDTSGRSWRAKAQDSFGAESGWSGSWTLKKDTVKPIAILNQENGYSPDTSIWVNLSESDDRSGIKQGDVDISINDGPWQNLYNTTNNFTYTGQHGFKYEFRYRAQDNASNWSSFDYDGWVIIDRPPTATLHTVEPKNYCTNPIQYFSWQFQDPDPEDTQGAYQLQVDKEGDFLSFGPGEFDSGKVYSSTQNIQVVVAKNPGSNQLGYNTHYYWRLKVWDEHGASSGWIYGPAFDTEVHIYPTPDFIWTPTSPTQGEIVQFCATCNDESTCYDINNNKISCSGQSFLWTFPEGTTFATGSSPTSENPRVKFNSTGEKIVTLEITDDVGTCSKTKTIGVMLPLPKWKEISP